MCSKKNKRAVVKIWNLVTKGIVVDELILSHHIRDLGLDRFFGNPKNRFWDRVHIHTDVYFVEYKGSLGRVMKHISARYMAEI